MAERNVSVDHVTIWRLALGPEIRPGTAPTLPVGTADDEPIVASGRDLPQDRGQLNLLI